MPGIAEEIGVNFELSLNNWLDSLQKTVLDPQVNNRQSVGLPPYTLHREDGRVFIRIVRKQGEHHASAFAFVAREDGENKGLGKWRKGDIFKPATWKAPAKHARGNIFENLPNCGVTQWTGPNYL